MILYESASSFTKEHEGNKTFQLPTTVERLLSSTEFLFRTPNKQSSDKLAPCPNHLSFSCI